MSVIVPVFDNAAQLKFCLASLGLQTLGKDVFEVLVVDNGCEIPVPEDLDTGSLRIEVLKEPAQGSYAARNRGIAQARADVIAFTDVDCLPDADWLKRGLEALTDGGADFVAGRIDVTFADPSRPTAVERYERAFSFRQKDYVQGWGFGATANLFVRKGTFDSVGLFDPELKSLGDREWGRRAMLAGMRAAYVDEARVSHPARRTLRSLAARCARVTGGYFALAARRNRSLVSLVGDAPIGLPFGHERPSGLGERIQVWCLAAFVVLVRALELIRLSAGFEPRR